MGPDSHSPAIPQPAPSAFDDVPGNLSHIAPTIWSADDLEQPNHQETFGIAASSHQQAEQLPSTKRKRTNSAKPKRAGPPVTRERNWTHDETSALLKFVSKPVFKPPRTEIHWELIVEAIQGELGANSAITVKPCKDRLKTLAGERYYKLVTSTWERIEREKDNPTEDDLRNLIESCGLTVDWYEAIKKYKAIYKGQGQGRSRMNIDRNSIPDGPNRPSSSSVPTVSDPLEPVQPTSPQNAETIVERFKSLKDSQRSTLLDLIFGSEVWDNNLLPKVCEWLSIVQDQRDLAICGDVFALEKTGLVSWEYDDKMGEESGLRVDFKSLRVDQNSFVMERNSADDTRRRIQDEAMVKFDAKCAPSGVTTLHLCECKELEVVDLSGFRKLRWLSIWNCGKLREMIGWECLQELGWLEIHDCPLYDGYPPLQKIPSLKEFHLWPSRDFSTSSPVSQGGELDVSGCLRLRRLGLGSVTVLVR